MTWLSVNYLQVQLDWNVNRLNHFISFYINITGAVYQMFIFGSILVQNAPKKKHV